MNPLLIPALIEAGLVTYRDVKASTSATNPITNFPLPSQYVAVLVVFGALSLVPESGSRLAAVIGWGFVIATGLNLFQPGANVAVTNASINS